MFDIFGNFEQDLEKEKKAMERVKEAEIKKKAKQYEPSWEEVWITGYPTSTGNHKKGIFQTKITGKDAERLKAVKTAIENEEIGTEVESLKKFSKSHALNLYKKLMEIRRAEIIKEYIENMPDNYHLINTHEQMEWVENMLDVAYVNGQYVGLDTETTGVEWVDRTVGVSISFMNDTHVYIPYGHVTDVPQLTQGFVSKKLKKHLERQGIKLILHNSKFDAHMLLKDGINIRENIFADTMVIQAILNENEESFALKNIANKYGRFFNYHDESLTFEELFGKNPQNFIEADMRLATYYASKDTHLTLLLFQWQLSMMEKQPNLKSVYFDIEQKITPVCIDMEDIGFDVDFHFGEEYKNELQRQVDDLEVKIKKVFGDININSSQQLQAVLYDKMKLEDVSGKRSADAKTLKKLAKKEPRIKLILDYRELKKLLSTYIEPLPQKVRPDTKRLTGVFNQIGTVTGRFSSKDPNLQNLPYKARHLFKAPEGFLIYGIDYSQIEPRTLASMSGDSGLRHPYLEGIDLYATLASNTFGLEYEACLEKDDETWRKSGLPKHPRKMMKVGLLASMYGISVPSLGESLGISVAEAQKFMDDFYKAYPRMTEWMDEVVKFAEENSYVLTLHGRKRRFIGFKETARQYHAYVRRISNLLGRKLEDSDNIWRLEIPRDLKRKFWDVKKEYSRVARQAVNAVIQGSASEIMKIAMIKVREYLKTKEGWKLLATIHDELLFEIPVTATEQEIRELEAIMIDAVKLEVPIKCDVETAQVWGKGVPFAEYLEKGMEVFA
ncbi:DNA polymerase [Priestia aryabhattai]|uniref:DNA polymerase n=1 Tax=Priestia aryabhattai TaxID=412384 RepID=UPI002041CAA4|nr:DNA polymerase [Priestia aryabhattai]MCM3639670.1 DNA polymerase [Priestia aryabhattai]